MSLISTGLSRLIEFLKFPKIQFVLLKKCALYLRGLYPLLMFYTTATAATAKFPGKTHFITMDIEFPIE